MGRIGGAVLALAIVVAGAGCGGSDNDSASSGAATTAAGATSAGTSEGSTDGSVEGGPEAEGAAQPLEAGRAIAYTADIAVATDDVGDAVRRSRDIAVANGGLLFDEAVVLGDPAEGQATLKVPPDRLSATLDQLGALGEVTSRSQQADDVTTQVVDLDARIETARTSVERLQEFLGDAESVEDLAALEAELTQRETELEQLVAQQRALEGQVELATVTAVFSEPDDDDAIEGIPGVGSAFRAGLDAFVAVVQVALVVVAWALPFLALAALVTGVVLCGAGVDEPVARPAQARPPRPARLA